MGRKKAKARVGDKRVLKCRLLNLDESSGGVQHVSGRKGQVRTGSEDGDGTVRVQYGTVQYSAVRVGTVRSIARMYMYVPGGLRTAGM